MNGHMDCLARRCLLVTVPLDRCHEAALVVDEPLVPHTAAWALDKQYLISDRYDVRGQITSSSEEQQV